MPPRDLVTVDTSYSEAPTVTLLDDRSHPIELEYAEPSPVMEFFSKLGRRIAFLIKTTLILGAIGAYPAFVVASHQIDDSPIAFAEGYEWTVPETGIAVSLIAREKEGPGWAADRPAWHPQARLTALPAWQDGIADSLSDYTRLIAAETGDEDVASASRLLVPQDGSMEARLTAAAESLARYDARVENGHAKAPSGAASLSDRLRLTAGWAQDARADLAVEIRTPGGFPAQKGAIESYYTAKARAHAAHELLSAALASEHAEIEARGLEGNVREALDIWRRAAEQRPVLVANQRGDGAFFGNHLTGMAFLMDEATATTLFLADALNEPAPEPVSDEVAELAATSSP